tara:strand:+ start:350 stop:502 length:153 start_codon:yes stop_codon:yes gene_type:complete
MTVSTIHTKFTCMKFMRIIYRLVRTIAYICKFWGTKIRKKEYNRPKCTSP